MKLSIITCTYNSEKHLQQCINSVVEQKLNPEIFEHIFIDWKSKDQTELIIKEYIRKYPWWNIRLETREKNGIYNAMNEGIKIASWEYILFLHSDDFLEKLMIWRYIEFIEQTEHKDLYYALKYSYHEHLKTKKIWLIYYLFCKLWFKKHLLWITTYVSQPTVLEKKEIFKRFWYFDENIKIASDLKHYIDVAGKITSKHYSHIITNFRIHNESTSSGKQAAEILVELEDIFKLNFNYILRKIYMFLNKIYHK